MWALVFFWLELNCQFGIMNLMLLKDFLFNGIDTGKFSPEWVQFSDFFVNFLF